MRLWDGKCQTSGVRRAVERIWEEGGPGAWLLSPLAALYGVGWLGYLGVYAVGIKKAKRPHRPVICVGNLVAGGTGKTPLTLAVADLIAKSGRAVVVSSSGYGSPRQHGAQFAPPGELDVDEWGDEATMMRWLRPELNLVVGRDRVEAATVINTKAPGAVMVMDDGMQHLPLAKDVVLAVDVKGKNGLCFPAGPYREPRAVGLRRADRVMRPGVDFSGRIVRFRDFSGNERTGLGEVDAVCAVANPGRFFKSLESAGLKVGTRRALTDHDPMDGTEVLEGLGTEKPVVTTAKDFVKLRSRQDLSQRDVVVAEYEVELADAEAFWSWLAVRLDESVS